MLLAFRFTSKSSYDIINTIIYNKIRVDILKKCYYCGKSITYHEVYCSDLCKEETQKYNIKRDRFVRFLSVTNIIGIFGVPVGLFLYPIIGVAGIWIISISCFLLGTTTIFAPIPVENMISKFKLKKAVFYSKILGVLLLVMSLAAALYAVYK